MAGVLEGALVLGVCKLACSLFFLSAIPGIISFCFCCLLMFTDILVTGRRLHTKQQSSSLPVHCHPLYFILFVCTLLVFVGFYLSVLVVFWTLPLFLGIGWGVACLRGQRPDPGPFLTQNPTPYSHEAKYPPALHVTFLPSQSQPGCVCARQVSSSSCGLLIPGRPSWPLTATSSPCASYSSSDTPTRRRCS